MEVKKRIQLIDTLRGVAITGILLIHHIEHFDFYLKPKFTNPTLSKIDSWIWENVFLLVSGKAFALFSLLFGVSFWILYENRTNKGESYFTRHIWRMLLLAIFGVLHLLFFRGDILIMYAFLGVFLLISRFLNNTCLLILASVLILNPFNIYNVFAYLFDFQLYNYKIPFPKSSINTILGEGSFFDVLKMNFTTGYQSTLIWSWNVGRFFTILGLFFLGIFIRKKRMFSEINLKTWYSILVISILLIYFFNFLDTIWIKKIENKSMKNLLKPMNDMYFKLSLLSTFLGAIVILWKHNQGNVWISKFKNFGRMGLSNYILMSVFGSFLYYNWGLGLYKYCGSLISLCIGVLFLILQMYFSDWWLKKYKQGPLEYIWRKMTWIKI